MADVLEELVKLLSLERIEENLFRGQSQDLGWGTVFGGQVLGQALAAAAYTVPFDRRAHSLHAYFLRPGNVHRPIVYDVNRVRDGASFTTRRIKAIQEGRPIFDMAASFQKVEAGFEHAASMPQVEAPDAYPTEQERYANGSTQLPEPLRSLAVAPRPFEHRVVRGDPDDLLHPSPGSPARCVWFRATGHLSDEPALHAYLLAYATDHGFMTSALLPHGVTWLTPGLQLASIDHALWFHRPFRVDDWLLYAIDSPHAGGARGLVRGQIFSRDGTLVACVAQEGLMRMTAADRAGGAAGA